MPEQAIDLLTASLADLAKVQPKPGSATPLANGKQKIREARSLLEVPPVVEPPPPSTPPMIVGLNAANWGTQSPADMKGSVPHVRADTELGGAFVKALASAGLTLNLLFAGPYSTSGVTGISADQWVANTLAFYKANVTPSQAPIVEVLNEPGGTWFWGSSALSPANAVAYRELVRKTAAAFRAAYGSSAPKIIATVDGSNGLAFGTGWWTPECAQFCDGVIVHPYGGVGSKAESALGNRKRVEDAHALTGAPVYVTEVGWPTAVGQPATGDSLQWTETEQAANISAFIPWARGLGYVAQVIYFCYHDFGTNNFYGVFRKDGSPKPGRDALKAAALQTA